MNTPQLNFEDWLAITQLYADYASAVDSGQWTSKGMLKDRAYGIKETLFHDPYYQRHVVGMPVVREAQADPGRWRCEANYAVFRTKLSEVSTVFNVGRYLDIIVRTPQGLKFASRECIYDSEMIPNSIIYPI
jgi:salicylate 5-hydroxylase small subunit